MEQTETLRDRQRRDATAITMAKVGLILAGIGAMVIVLDLFGLGELGLVLTVVGSGLALPFGIGERWYYAVAGGSILGVIAWLLAGPHQTTGGFLAVIAAIVVVIGACLGYPMESDD